MGAKVSGFVKDVAKVVAKAGTSYVLGKIPVVGTPVANWINKQYRDGGMVRAFADGGVASNKPKMVINNAKQLIALVKKVPDIAEKHGLTPELIREEVAKAKEGEAVVAKARGGRMKKGLKGEDSVMVRTGHEPAHFAKGGRALSIF